MKVAKGILTKGLTGRDGHPSAMILGRFNLGPLSITIGGGPPSPKPPGPVPPKDRKTVTITVTHKKYRWQRKYLIDDKMAGVLVKVTKIINTIVNKISVSVHNIRQTFKQMTVDVWRKKK